MHSKNNIKNIKLITEELQKKTANNEGTNIR